MTLGILIMLATGLCTVIFTIGAPSDFLLALTFGALPFLLGVGLYFLGRRLSGK